MKICYHGTDRAAAESILREGFRARTYFAQHLEDALAFGGLHVFEVAFGEEARELDWQFRIQRKRPSKHIVRYTVYKKPSQVFENGKLRERVFKSNFKSPRAWQDSGKSKSHANKGVMPSGKESRF